MFVVDCIIPNLYINICILNIVIAKIGLFILSVMPNIEI